VAGRLQAGTVFVNAHGTSAMDHRAPFGGWKQSGYGLELGPEGMRAFTRPRTILRFPAS
jgi:acyl-CoA reductase-like NAD-dependent aldehyde dehydrogenase